MAVNLGKIVISIDPEAIATMDRLSESIGRLLDRLAIEEFPWADSAASVSILPEIPNGVIYGQLVAIRDIILENERITAVDLINRMMQTVNPAPDQ